MITLVPVTGIGEVAPGDDLAATLLAGCALRDGDIVVVTSKIVSKAESRVVAGDRDQLLAQETDRVVARRGATSIVRTHHGLVMAAAGIDASNTEPGTVVLLPVDPDASAVRLREAVAAAGGPNVAVVVTDTSGRAWRNGQTDIAIGAAGMQVLEDHAGRADGYGNVLAVTAPALADEVAAAADLVTGKLSRSPVAVVQGLGHLVLPPGEHGAGARALVRDESQDMFGLGAREAVLQALLGEDPRGFGAPVGAHELADALGRLLPDMEATVTPGDREVTLRPATDHDESRGGRIEERASVLAFALGWRIDPGERSALRFRPAST